MCKDLSLGEEFDAFFELVQEMGLEGEDAERFMAQFLHTAIENIRSEIYGNSTENDRDNV